MQPWPNKVPLRYMHKGSKNWPTWCCLWQLWQMVSYQLHVHDYSRLCPSCQLTHPQCGSAVLATPQIAARSTVEESSYNSLLALSSDVPHSLCPSIGSGIGFVRPISTCTCSLESVPLMSICSSCMSFSLIIVPPKPCLLLVVNKPYHLI